MKRSPLRRKAALRPGSRRMKRSPLKRVNARRKRERFERAYGSVARVLWYRSCACVVPGCPGRSEYAHVRSRGAGGTADDGVPACNAHHRLLHRLGVRLFNAMFGIDLADLAAQHALRWRAFSQPVEPVNPTREV